MDLTCDDCHRSGFSTKASLNSHKSKYHPSKHMKSQHSPQQSMALRVYNRNDDDVEHLNSYLDNNKNQLDPSTWKSLKQKVNGSKTAKTLKLIPKPQNGLLRIKAKNSQKGLYPLIPTGTKRKSVGQGGLVKRPDKRSARPQSDDLILIPTGTKRKPVGQGGLVKRSDKRSVRAQSDDLNFMLA